jgi:hypothetical protein
MHKEILSPAQEKMLPLIKKFSHDFYLTGGTAIALHLGHRRSIDFDLFRGTDFRNADIRKKIISVCPIEHVMFDQKDEYTVVAGGVKLTFLFYDFPIEAKNRLDNVINLPDLLTLAAMKAYALGRRAKWKDYVDLFFVLRDHHSLAQICARAKKIFGAEFNEKIFREQLGYFKDIDYSEKVDFLPGFAVADNEIKKMLAEQI